jgi:hypothetical protein
MIDPSAQPFLGRQVLANDERGLRASVASGVPSWWGAWRRPVAAVLLLAGLVSAVWLDREPLLRGATNLWIISDPITHADAAVVLGGGPEIRPLVAADL